MPLLEPLLPRIGGRALTTKRPGDVAVIGPLNPLRELRTAQRAHASVEPSLRQRIP